MRFYCVRVPKDSWGDSSDIYDEEWFTSEAKARLRVHEILTTDDRTEADALPIQLLRMDLSEHGGRKATYLRLLNREVERNRTFLQEWPMPIRKEDD